MRIFLVKRYLENSWIFLFFWNFYLQIRFESNWRLARRGHDTNHPPRVEARQLFVSVEVMYFEPALEGVPSIQTFGRLECGKIGQLKFSA